MIRALWRYWRARRRLLKHQAQHGDLVGDLATWRGTSRRQAAGALAKAYTEPSPRAQGDVSRETCGRLLGAGVLEPRPCTRRAGHAGPHIHNFGHLELHTAQPLEGDPDDGAPLLEAPERRSTWHPRG